MSTFEFDDSSMSGLGGEQAGKVDTASIPEGQGLQAAPAAAAKAAQPAAAKGGAPRGQIYTMMAREGVNAAEVINTALKKREVGKETPRRVEVIAPHGPSTSGGKRARQSITLAPASGQGASLMCGFLDVAQKVAELRDYALVAEQFQRRFGARFDVSAEDYGALMKQLGGILETLGFRVSAEQAEASQAAAPETGADEESGEDEEFRLTGPERKKLAMLAGGALVLVAFIVLALR